MRSPIVSETTLLGSVSTCCRLTRMSTLPERCVLFNSGKAWLSGGMAMEHSLMWIILSLLVWWLKPTEVVFPLADC